jgi:hypothetical protein
MERALDRIRAIKLPPLSEIKRPNISAANIAAGRSFLARLPWRWFVLLPLIAAASHIVATFLSMGDNTGRAHQKLAAGLPANTMSVIAPVTPNAQPLPYLAPDARYAMCPFSTEEGPLAVNAVLPDLGWTLGVYHADGSGAYFAAGTQGRVTTIAVTVVPDDTRFMGLTPQARGLGIDASPQLAVGAKSGVIVVRAPDRGAAYTTSATETLALARCGVSKP